MEDGEDEKRVGTKTCPNCRSVRQMTESQFLEDAVVVNVFSFTYLNNH